MNLLNTDINKPQQNGIADERSNRPLELLVIPHAILMRREWAMPSKHTFKIKHIDALIKKYVGSGFGWADPFAGENSPAEFTNDLNPVKPTKYHLHAREFSKLMPDGLKGVLFDPPYSLRQVKECYTEMGFDKIDQFDTQYFFSDVKKILAYKVNNGGYAISFGWSTQGFGKLYGFKIIEILDICHGRGHNDTLCTVEQKIAHQNHLFPERAV